MVRESNKKTLLSIESIDVIHNATFLHLGEKAKKMTEARESVESRALQSVRSKITFYEKYKVPLSQSLIKKNEMKSRADVVLSTLDDFAWNVRNFLQISNLHLTQIFNLKLEIFKTTYMHKCSSSLCLVIHSVIHMFTLKQLCTLT